MAQIAEIESDNLTISPVFSIGTIGHLFRFPRLPIRIGHKGCREIARRCRAKLDYPDPALPFSLGS